MTDPVARRRSREAAVQMLYALSPAPGPSVGTALEAGILEFWTHFSAPEGARAFADELVRGVFAALPRLDALLEQASKNWRLDRMAKIDLAILRLAAYELTVDVGVPREVAIDEAIELAKTFSTEDAAKFVNGVLAGVVTGTA